MKSDNEFSNYNWEDVVLVARLQLQRQLHCICLGSRGYPGVTSDGSIPHFFCGQSFSCRRSRHIFDSLHLGFARKQELRIVDVLGQLCALVP